MSFKFQLGVSKEDNHTKTTSKKKIPPFSYAYSPPAIELPKKANMFDIAVNIEENIGQVSALLLDGVDCKGKDATLGDAYYVDTNMTCDETSEQICIGRPVTIQIKNFDNSFSCDSSCNQSAGLMQSILNDIVEISPMALVDSMRGKGDTVGRSCEVREAYVKHKYPLKNATTYDTKYACMPRKQNVCETFIDIKNKRKETSLSRITFILMFVVILIILTFIMYSVSQFLALFAIVLVVFGMVFYSRKYYLTESFSDVYSQDDISQFKNIFSSYDKKQTGKLSDKNATEYKDVIKKTMNIPLDTKSKTRKFDDIKKEIESSERNRRDPMRCYMMNNYADVCSANKDCMYSDTKQECIPKEKQNWFKKFINNIKNFFKKKDTKNDAEDNTLSPITNQVNQENNSQVSDNGNKQDNSDVKQESEPETEDIQVKKEEPEAEPKREPQPEPQPESYNSNDYCPIGESEGYKIIYNDLTDPRYDTEPCRAFSENVPVYTVAKRNSYPPPRPKQICGFNQ
tara:strand:- start:1146 stop:2687 length:1542 start_codon:yes stop_codon:yes gene_type:complete